MAADMLTVKDLRVSVEDSEILHGVDISIGPGETHVLMGPNGAGKSTLGNALMGNPQYTVTGGEVRFHGEDLLEKSVNERAASGLFMSFQNPIEIPGISLENFMRSAIEQRSGTKLRLWDFRKQVRATLDTLQMEHSYAERDLNVGFSGGEKKKAEILQLLLLKPSLAILDETDSGLDVDAVKTVSRGIKEFQKDQEASLLVITHNAAILDALHVDKVHVPDNGRMVKEGGAERIKEIEENGFSAFEGAIA